jgi:hypothetical protein
MHQKAKVLKINSNTIKAFLASDEKRESLKKRME